MSDVGLPAFVAGNGQAAVGAKPYAARKNAILRTRYAASAKPMLDVFLGFAFGLIALPVILICCALVALDGKSPFYSQKRVGRDGRHFRMWKIRTMVADADSKLAAYLIENPEARQEWDQYQKLRKDPRITWIGRVLRKTSIDELPQFWNVLVGDMSVVGPRPMMVGQEELYPGTSYYDLKPGLTGPWQVSDRNASSFADRARFDDAYLDSLSFRTDIWLIGRTIRTVLRGSGC